MYFHLDCFTSLDDLSAKDRRDTGKVLAALDRARRFSAFDIDLSLAPQISRLVSAGWIELVSKEYPWTDVIVTPAGKAALRGEA